jgi:hypothetical protein
MSSLGGNFAKAAGALSECRELFSVERNLISLLPAVQFKLMALLQDCRPYQQDKAHHFQEMYDYCCKIIFRKVFLSRTFT